MGSTGSWQHAQIDLGEAHLGAPRREPQIARQGQFQTTAEGVPVERRDRRHGHRLNLVEDVLDPRDVASEADAVQGSEEFDICAGDEQAAVGSDDERSDCGIGGCGRDGVAEFVDEMIVQGIGRRPVDGEQGDPVADLGRDVF